MPDPLDYLLLPLHRLFRYVGLPNSHYNVRYSSERTQLFGATPTHLRECGRCYSLPPRPTPIPQHSKQQMRAMIKRKIGGLEDNCMCEYCVHFWLDPCVTCQELRAVKAINNSLGAPNAGNATTVVVTTTTTSGAPAVVEMEA